MTKENGLFVKVSVVGGKKLESQRFKCKWAQLQIGLLFSDKIKQMNQAKILEENQSKWELDWLKDHKNCGVAAPEKTSKQIKEELLLEEELIDEFYFLELKVKNFLVKMVTSNQIKKRSSSAELIINNNIVFLIFVINSFKMIGLKNENDLKFFQNIFGKQIRNELLLNFFEMNKQNRTDHFEENKLEEETDNTIKNLNNIIKQRKMEVSEIEKKKKQ